MKDGKETSSLAKHWGNRSHWLELASDKIPTPRQIRNKMDFQILYLGDPMSVVRSFGTDRCRICMHEKLFILDASFKSPELLINSRNEIHGTCLHRPRFHRFSADDSSEEESARLRNLRRYGPRTVTNQITVCQPCAPGTNSISVLDI